MQFLTPARLRTLATGAWMRWFVIVVFKIVSALEQW
jgi:hypothetical protein